MLSFRHGILFSICGALALGTLVFAGCGDENAGPASPNGDSVAPAIPDGLFGSVEKGAVELIWNANLSDPDLAGYIVLRSPDLRSGYVALTRTVSTNNWTDPSPAPGNTYYYRVSAVDVNGNLSPMSEALMVPLPVHDDREGPRVSG